MRYSRDSIRDSKRISDPPLTALSATQYWVCNAISIVYDIHAQKGKIMSFATTFDAFQIDNLTSGQKAVLTTLATFERNGKAWPSVATIAKRASMGIRTVQRHLAALVNLGYIERIYRAGRAAVTRLFIGQTPAKLAPPPLPNWHPESGIPESVNEITAAPASPAAVSPPSLFSEIPEQPKTAIEPSQDAGGTIALPEPVQAVVGHSDALTAETMASEVVDLQVDTLAIDPLAEVPQSLMQDWAEVRKHKKKTPKPVKAEVNALVLEAQKAGLSVKDVILLMVLRGWSRFEASWLQHVPAQAVVQGQEAVFKPEPLPVATPSVVAAAKARLAELRAQIVGDSARKREEQVAVRR